MLFSFDGLSMLTLSATAAPPPYNPTLMIIFSVAMLVVLYLIMILPQRRADKKQKLERSRLKVGDQVVTIGGLTGKIVNIKEDDITIATSVAQTMVTYRRDAVNLLVNSGAVAEAKVTTKK